MDTSNDAELTLPRVDFRLVGAGVNCLEPYTMCPNLGEVFGTLAYGAYRMNTGFIETPPVVRHQHFTGTQDDGNAFAISISGCSNACKGIIGVLN